ncbi:MAG: TetR/AcrR family transcriptional regulator [Acidimicrobiia bacterium]|nr:TetR/AcrR family transcriptional regulator [Acidimicrobiia bacterium]
MSASTATAGATRDRIVDAALRLFSERGTAAVSVRELADAAGVTVPGLYYHFASKADLISEVYRAKGFGQPLETFVPPTASGLEERVIEQARAEFARFVENADFLRHMQRESVLGDEDAREVGVALAEQWRARWKLVLSGSSDVAPSADLDVAVDFIATLLWGLFVDYLNHGDAPSIVVRIDAFTRLLARGLTRATA